MPEILRIETRTVADVLVVVLHGELDLSGAEAAHSALAAAAARRPRVLALDLSALSFMDSTGVSVLTRAQRRAAAEGTRFVVLNGTGVPHKVIRLLGLDKALELVDDLDALNS
jgi:anti-sigma B factor antagonist